MKFLNQILMVLALILGSTGSYPVMAQDEADCSQIVAEFEAYSKKVNENNLAVANFVGEVSVAMDDWYAEYSGFEGQTVSIEPGYFTPLQEGADGIAEIVDLAYQQLDTLEQEGLRFKNRLEQCLSAGRP